MKIVPREVKASNFCMCNGRRPVKAVCVNLTPLATRGMPVTGSLYRSCWCACLPRRRPWFESRRVGPVTFGAVTRMEVRFRGMSVNGCRPVRVVHVNLTPLISKDCGH